MGGSTFPLTPGEEVLPTYMQAIPVKSRPGIHSVITKTFQGERHGMDAHYRATLGVLGVIGRVVCNLGTPEERRARQTRKQRQKNAVPPKTG